MAAKSILQVAERVEKALEEAQVLQKSVDDGIVKTNQNILDANNSLAKVLFIFYIPYNFFFFLFQLEIFIML